MTQKELQKVLDDHNLWLENKGGQCANLRCADLQDADLRSANLRYANLQDAINIPNHVKETYNNIPKRKDIIGYKKCKSATGRYLIVKLLIPAKAKRSKSTANKCRAEYAVVLSIQKGRKYAYSIHDRSFTYSKNAIVKPLEPFDENWNNECSSGIHFFMTRKEAEEFNT